jgi:PAS domain S-box-containing protein
MILEPEQELILEANAAACSAYGYDHNELVGMSLKKFSRDAEKGQAHMRDFLEGQPLNNYESIHFNRNGEDIHFLINCALIEYDGKEAILSINRDITERKQAEQALRESEELYRQAIEVAGGVPYREMYTPGSSHVDYQFIGEGIRQIAGYGPEEFSASLWENITLEMHLLEDLAKYSVEEAVQRVRSGKNPLWKCDFKIRARDGTIHWVFEAAVELRDEHGISYGSIGIYQDITERKRAEEEIKKQLDELQRWHIATLGRETRILDLKREVNELLGKTGQPPRYPSAETLL